MPAVLCGALLSTAAAFSGTPVAAQTAAAASLTGIVTDVGGSPLGDVRVTVSGANVSRARRSGPDGRFTVAVPPGTYSVGASANGFEAQNRSTSINTTTAAQTFVSSQTFVDQGQGKSSTCSLPRKKSSAMQFQYEPSRRDAVHKPPSDKQSDYRLV